MDGVSTGRVVLGAAVIAAVGGFVAALPGAALNYAAADRQLDGKLVELGVSILAADPGKSDVTPARQWAIELVEEHAGKRFSDEDRLRLMHLPLNTVLIAGEPVTIGGSPLAIGAEQATVPKPHP